MRAYADEFGIVMTHAWGMTELSPLGSIAREPAGRHRRGGLAVPGVPGAAVLRRRGTADRRQRRGAAVRRQGRRRARGPRPVGHRVVLPGQGAGEVPRRLAAHRRRGHAGRGGVHQAHRPGQGRDQVRRRVDLVHGAGEPADGAPGRRRGGGDRGAGRASGASGRSPRSCCAPTRRRRPRTSCAPSSASGCRAGSFPSAGAYIDEVPKTSVGKFKKTRLRDQYAAGELDVTTLAPAPALTRATPGVALPSPPGTGTLFGTTSFTVSAAG